ncbi:amidohydrolase family protein [Gracilimonas mengyeensis]|uniref:Amidohydrolase family protein n=1 Tax=Gracilimonas mengyeensis TaxID=1302730 RepID=A0A521EEI1_9BACT|nr:amidohydrolase family protein [Gracilimonas mengyeensis]SMO82262.1 Amidohydrolase family protein [Gracilimonas mengyeensis]
MKYLYTLFLFLFFGMMSLQAQMPDAPERTEGDGPYERLIIRGVNLIDGTGAPATGPVDIVVKNNRIQSIQTVGYPGLPIQEQRRPKAGENDQVIEAEGMYLLPGFFDMHAHTGGNAQGTTPEYVYKLWLAHGITSIREPGSFNGMDWTLRHKELSKNNEITAPRISAWIGFGMDYGEPIDSPEDARKWVQMIHKKGADGIKFFGASPEIYAAAIDESNKLGLGTMTHHAQTRVVYNHALKSAQLGLTSMTHWYGLPESMFEDKIIQDYPLDYNYNNEQHRFEEAGKLWKQAAAPGSEKWEAVMDEMIELDFTLNPTFTIYEANRNLMAQRRAEWHEKYTLPSLWEFYKPSKISHGSYWLNWGTEQEIAWKENYRLWMQFVNEYKNKGGRVTLGSDAGYIYKLYGFGYIQEMELMREAGFHPLEIFQSASLKAAEVLGVDDELGTIEPGKLADMVIVDANPMENLKVLYGTGAVFVNEDNEVTRKGGVRYTIKDGIVYDAKELLKDVEEMVQQSKEEKDYTITQPGLDY